MDTSELPAWISDDPALARIRSAAAGKPLLLYWTAGWCPPCQEMRVTVLRTPEFARAAREWVLGELSGDAPGAQVWGERLRLTTYPTMLVLSASGEEIVRLPGGLPVERFCKGLEVARSARRGVTALAAAILQGDAVSGAKEELSASELTLLAYHSWRQDTHSLATGERTRFFRQLAGIVPPALEDERARVIAQWVVEESAAGAAECGELCRQFLEVLGGRAATYANLYYLNVDPRPAVTLLTEKGGVERAFLTAAWSVAIETSLAEEALSGTERLIAHAALVSLSKARGDDGDVPLALRQRCAQLAHELDRTTADSKERQSVMNMAGHLLRFVGMPQDSQRMFERELTRSADPYYFMPYLADLARERGDVAEALDWMQRARDEAPGSATRFALSGRYISSLITATPQDVQRVVAGSRQALEELQGIRAVAYGVFRRTLHALVGELVTWVAGGPIERTRGVEEIGALLRGLAEAETDDGSREQLRAAEEDLLRSIERKSC